MKHLRYKGEFFSLAGIRWRAEIWQESPQEYAAVGRLDFPAEDALEIAWNEVDKLEPVHGSCATLTVVSRTDRQYVDLYTVEAGSIRLDVYREGAFYWSGTLDTELYAEPFAYENEYEVELTFSDFAMLERTNFSGSGYKTLQELIDGALDLSCIKRGETVKHISTSRPGDASADTLLAGTCINCGNFYDEDGEAMTVREVLDEVLRPFALHLRQKQGQVFIYDLNALQTLVDNGSKALETLEWDSNDAELGVDKVYKSVKVTFSPYVQSELIRQEVDTQRLAPLIPDLLVRQDYSPGSGNTLGAQEGFYLDLFSHGASLKNITLGCDAKPFRIKSVFSGSDCEGIASIIKIAENSHSSYRTIVDNGLFWDSANKGILFSMNKRAHLPNIAYSGLSRTPDVLLRLRMEMLYDVRYNPYEEAGKYNEQGDYGKMKIYLSAILVPFRLRIRDEEGTVRWHYRNVDPRYPSPITLMPPLDSSSWVEGDYPPTYGNGCSDRAFSLLSYYQPDTSNLDTYRPPYPGGWQTNRQSVSDWTYRNAKKYMQMGDGEYITIPDGVSGTIELEIERGIYAACNPFKGAIAGDRPVIQNEEKPFTGMTEKTRWLLYKTPRLDFVDRFGREVEAEDIEHSSWVNAAAREELKVDVVCGCGNASQKRGFGILLRTEDRKPVGTFTRAGVTDSLEKLLIGTVYSNYARRMNCLAGTVRLLPGFALYTDRAEPGCYLVLSEVQNAQADTSEVKVVQVEADHYEGIVYDNE